LGARLLRILVLIILHQEYISLVTRDIITHRAFIIQRELFYNPIKKKICQTKYTKEIKAEQQKFYYLQANTPAEEKNKFNIDRPILPAVRHATVPIITINTHKDMKIIKT
jgi:hypothetical protein